MIINTGQRTDIPAFYAEWFANRLREGVVCVRNPYNRQQVTRYRLDPEVVDLIGFCSKNPEPMFPYMDLLQDYGQFWYMTLTPYGPDIEPGVPDKSHQLLVFRQLSDMVGPERVGWRYDPILVNETYSVERHLKAFARMAEALDGCTRIVVISFIDLYGKLLRTFPEARSVTRKDQEVLGREIVRIARQHGMTVHPCSEGSWLSEYGADCRGCMTVEMYEHAMKYTGYPGKTGNGSGGHSQAGMQQEARSESGEPSELWTPRRLHLTVPPYKPAREACACYLACDIGAYDTCLHLCRYCYANSDGKLVRENHRRHDPQSPFLIGNYEPGDHIHDAVQKSWIDPQMSLFDL